ncbi:multidrug resistance protein MdtL-like [Bolinopsis microptera]|uniref:multidrug resistance protein MdtL-like n=1 Tax=Bolinopsis microptera TaxID=2820187 RepID=UPI003078AD62
MSKSVLQIEDEHEQSCLVKKENESKSWTKIDLLLLVFGSLIHLGDGVEIYLPGVITQEVSCDLGLTNLQKNFLDCILYLTLTISITISGHLSDRFGRRELSLLSLYLSIVSTVVCAVVANYATLLLSRALIGFCVGLNLSIHTVLIAELVSSKLILADIMLIASLVYTAGGIWCAFLAYLLLEVLGWRTFILFTSLPIFVPPIFMLHFCLNKTDAQQAQDLTTNSDSDTEEKIPNFVARTTKLGLYCAVNSFQGWLTILLVPYLIQALKIDEVGSNSDCSTTVIQGLDFLLLALVTFAAVAGRLFVHHVRHLVCFRTLQLIVAVVNVGCFAGMLAQDNLVVVILTNFIVKFLFGITAMAATYILYDADYFGASGLASGSSIAYGIGLNGTVMVSFAPLLSVKVTAIVVSSLQILIVLSMTEVR